MVLEMLATGSFSDEHPVISVVGILLFILLCYAVMVVCARGMAKNLEGIGHDVDKAIENSNWYKARKERKEIEALERKVKRQQLEAQLEQKTDKEG
jgi:hypothetical protein